jgi:hypothetical protein
MKRNGGLLVLGIVLAALSGCSANKGTEPGDTALTQEQVNVATTITDAPELASDGLFDASTPAGYSVRGGAGTLSGSDDTSDPESDPRVSRTDRHWWRTINDVTRSIDFDFSSQDSTGRPRLAHVVVHKHFTGVFHVAWGEIVPGSEGHDSVVVHHEQKALKDHWVRHLWLARVGPDSSRTRGWHLVAASGAEVTSEVHDSGAQPEIQSIRMQVGDQDTTFADPAVAIQWHSLWTAPAGTPVTVTVTTLAPDDIVVFIHHDDRVLLNAGGDNTYTGTWSTPDVAGLKHFGVNALSNGTLYDTASKYHSHAWLFPYLNRGEAYASTGD